MNKIADRTVVNIGQLLFDNLQVIRDLNKPLTGVRLRICNPDPASVVLPGSKGGIKPQDTTAAAKASVSKPAAAAVNDSATTADAAAAGTAAAALGNLMPSQRPLLRASPSLANGIGLAEAQGGCGTIPTRLITVDCPHTPCIRVLCTSVVTKTQSHTQPPIQQSTIG